MDTFGIAVRIANELDINNQLQLSQDETLLSVINKIKLILDSELEDAGDNNE